MSRLRIPYESDNLSSEGIADGPAELPIAWNDLLWAAVTVGRPNRNYVFRHGTASSYEALFRWSLVRMALEQAGPRARRLRRTAAARTLDPTEKGAVSYFLGMTFCKVFAEKLLRTPWLLHLDVFGPQLGAVLSERSRPDLIGQDATGRWHAFECKGRVSPPDAEVKTKAKSQARRLIRVGGAPCSLHIGTVAFFRNERLCFYWCDPPPESGHEIQVSVGDGDWAYYYKPLVEILKAAPDGSTRLAAMEEEREVFSRVEEADLEVSLHPDLAGLLRREEWEPARRQAVELHPDLKSGVEDAYQIDGICIRAGESWAQPRENVA